MSTNGGWFLILGIYTYRLSTQVYTHLSIGFQKNQKPPNTIVCVYVCMYVWMHVCQTICSLNSCHYNKKILEKPFKWKIQCPLMSIVGHMDGHIIRICGQVHFVFH